MRALIVSSLILLALALTAGASLASWPNAPTVSVPVAVAANSQFQPVAVTDGAGGVIITWNDARSVASFDIYAQHVLASGVVDPAWPVNGRGICTFAADQITPAIATDGAGGAIIAWVDGRGGVSYDIYAQHVLASGVVDPVWPANGRALCTAVDLQELPVMVSDAAGGAIVAWDDSRSGAGQNDIYAQRVLASGVVDPAWPVDGRALCTAANQQTQQKIGSDGAGGAIVTWQDARSGGLDIYARRVLVNGVLDPAWPANGRAVCTAAGDQYVPRIAADGTGGAVITWTDPRNASLDIYAQRVLASGDVDPGWPANGRAVCTQPNSQSGPVIAPDGVGGAIVAWEDIRSSVNYDIYAQHVLAGGTVDPAWPADGRALCTAANNQDTPQIAADGAGGAFVVWYDTRGGAYQDLYAQHVTAAGTVDSYWPVDGRAVCTVNRDKNSPVIVNDGNGGAIVAWDDSRNGNADVFAGRVARYGWLGSPEPEIVSVRDVPSDQGGRVKVSWNASYLEADPYDIVTYYKVFRSVPPNLAAAMLRGGARAVRADETGFERPGDLLVTRDLTTTYYWEYISTVNADLLSNYSLVCATAEDSTIAGAPTTAFMIQARGYFGGNLHWESPPAAGYSVDNLGPAAPVPFTGQYLAGTTHLHWNPNTEADLAGYRLYRGTTLGFTPAPSNEIAAPPDTGYADAAAAPYIYKLVAVDIHGNVSPVSTLVPIGTTAVGDRERVADLALATSPNPAALAVTLRYALPRDADARLAIYDAAGRLVRDLARGAATAGDHAERWDLRDAGGRPVGAGLYFARVEALGRVVVRRIAVTR